MRRIVSPLSLRHKDADAKRGAIDHLNKLSGSSRHHWLSCPVNTISSSTVQQVLSLSLVIVLTAGFTGKLAAKYVVQHCSTDLAWAVAGRSHPKLTNLVTEIRPLNVNRRDPGIVVADSNDLEALTELARSTKVVVSMAGPFALYPFLG